VQAEEINIVQAGRNYGWPIMEGANCYVENFVGRTSCYLRKMRDRFVDPVAHYNRFLNDKVTEGRTSGVVGGNSVTGGYVYRGERFPSLQGQFFAADFIFGNVWSLKKLGNRWEASSSLKTAYQVSSFGEDEAGELYALEWGTGTVYSIIASDLTP
jgi:glucose/arabinose dehydrogenase